jgi:hypothetical protein
MRAIAAIGMIAIPSGCAASLPAPPPDEAKAISLSLWHFASPIYAHANSPVCVMNLTAPNLQSHRRWDISQVERPGNVRIVSEPWARVLCDESPYTVGTPLRHGETYVINIGQPDEKPLIQRFRKVDDQWKWDISPP